MKLDIPLLSQSKIKSISKLKLKKYRYNTNSYLCEGWRLFLAISKTKPEDVLVIIIDEDIKNSINIKYVIDFCKQHSIPLYKCPNKHFKSISDEKSPSGILFVASLKYYQSKDLAKIQSPNIIFLENISDPGNLGTIIRTASWFGFNEILISFNSVDPFNPKTVRASAGGIFKVNLYLNIDLASLVEFGQTNNFEFVGTTVKDGIKISNWKVNDKNIIFFGSEATGLTQSTKKLLNKNITVPGTGKLESLNLSVTTGIILNHLFSYK